MDFECIVEAMVEIVECFGGIDIFINNVFVIFLVGIVFIFM